MDLTEVRGRAHCGADDINLYEPRHPVAYSLERS
jgi:hypothetical protein